MSSEGAIVSLGHHRSSVSVELGLGKAQGPWVLIRHYGMTAPSTCPSDCSTLCRNVMSSQEVVDFIQSKITQKDENGVLRPLSSIVEEVRSRPSPSLPHTVFLHPSLVPDCALPLHHTGMFSTWGIWQHTGCNTGWNRSRDASEL